MTSTSRPPADDAKAPRQGRLAIDPDAGFPTMPAEEFYALRVSIGEQKEVAIELETARRTLGRWERNERPVPGIAAVAIRLLAEKAAARRERTLEAVAGIMAEQS